VGLALQLKNEFNPSKAKKQAKSNYQSNQWGETLKA
jgi:hypothetical protein